MFVISKLVENVIKKTMKNQIVELNTGGQRLADIKIQTDIFSCESLFSLLFIITMMPLNYILRNYKREYRFTTLQEKISHFLYLNDVRIFTPNNKQLETLIQTVRIFSEDKGSDFGIKKYLRLFEK